MSNLIERNIEEIKDNVRNFFKDEECKGRLEETCVKIWNQFAEDRHRDDDLLYDLHDREDFLCFYIECGFLDAIKEGKCENSSKRWGLYTPNYIDESKSAFNMLDVGDLEELIISWLDEITECVLAWPSLYSREFYESVAWPILNDIKAIDSFDLA